MLVIEVPAKIWRPKMISKYTTPDYYDDGMDDILDYGQYGRCLYKPEFTWDAGSKRVDIIVFDA